MFLAQVDLEKACLACTQKGKVFAAICAEVDDVRPCLQCMATQTLCTGKDGTQHVFDPKASSLLSFGRTIEMLIKDCRRSLPDFAETLSADRILQTSSIFLTGYLGLYVTRSLRTVTIKVGFVLSGAFFCL